MTNVRHHNQHTPSEGVLQYIEIQKKHNYTPQVLPKQGEKVLFFK